MLHFGVKNAVIRPHKKSKKRWFDTDCAGNRHSYRKFRSKIKRLNTLETGAESKGVSKDIQTVNKKRIKECT